MRRARNRLNTSFHQQRKALHLVYVKFVADYLDVVYPESEGGARLMAKDDEMIDWQVLAPLPPRLTAIQLAPPPSSCFGAPLGAYAPPFHRICFYPSPH